MKIEYVVGDATTPQGEGTKFIVHICNNYGGWGKGFVLALSKKWKGPEDSYRMLAEQYKKHELIPMGGIQIVYVAEDIRVVNMIAQNGYVNREHPVAVDYDAIAKGLRELKYAVMYYKGSVHMPRIGCGLGGGTWDKIEPIIQKELADYDIAVTVYDFK